MTRKLHKDKMSPSDSDKAASTFIGRLQNEENIQKMYLITHLRTVAFVTEDKVDNKRLDNFFPQFQKTLIYNFWMSQYRNI